MQSETTSEAKLRIEVSKLQGELLGTLIFLKNTAILSPEAIKRVNKRIEELNGLTKT
jgi:hypothetical protein